MTLDETLAKVRALKAAAKAEPPAPGVNAPVPPPAGSTAERWRRLHVMSYQPVRDPYAVLAEIYAAPIGLATCGCAAHGVDWLCERPPPVHDRAELAKWVVDWRNDIARRKGRTTFSYDASRAANPIAIHSSSTGLGDAVCGMYAACGLAAATGEPVVYRAHSAAWLAAVTFPGVVVEPIERGRLGPDMAGDAVAYRHRIGRATSMVRDYVRRIARGYGIRPFEPRRPSVMPIEPTPGQPIILAPLCAKPQYGRHWPAAKWADLARELIDRGHTVIGIGGHGDGDRLRSIFGPVKGSRFQWGMKPDEVAGLMTGASVVIGNDSGPMHFAGLLGAPAIAVHAGAMSHDFLYPLAPSVRSVLPSFRVPRADHNLPALESIPVSDVLTATLETLGGTGMAPAVAV